MKVPYWLKSVLKAAGMALLGIAEAKVEGKLKK